MNEPAAHLLGRSIAELVGQSVVDHQTWTDAFELVRLVAELEPQRVTLTRLVLRRPDGAPTSVEARLLPTDHDGKPACVVLANQDG